jgi:spore germination cell wall hydrolase CwlJ-like protein
MIPGLDKLDDETLSALNIYCEARGEPLEGQEAVMWVVKNRVDHPRWWGHDIHSVILTPNQFSWTSTANPEHINVSKLPDLDAFRKIVQGVLSSEIPNPVNGANLYFADYMRPWPAWAFNTKFIVQIGQQRFHMES